MMSTYKAKSNNKPTVSLRRVTPVSKLIKDRANLSKKIKAQKKWQKAADNINIAAEASNVGIVIEIAGKWAPPLMAIGAGVFSYIAFLADPLIYFFKSLNRLTRIVGRKCFGITFEEEKHGTHKYQTLADIVSLSLFVLAIPLFLGAIVASPIGITIAWAVALAGLCVTGHFEYGHQAKKTKEKHEAALADEKSTPEIKEEAKKEYISKRNSYRLFIGLLVGLTFLLICGSAAAFAPPALVPILFITSKIASGYLGLIACGRLLNWFKSKYDTKNKEPENKDNCTSDNVNTATIISNLGLDKTLSQHKDFEKPPQNQAPTDNHTLFSLKNSSKAKQDDDFEDNGVTLSKNQI